MTNSHATLSIASRVRRPGSRWARATSLLAAGVIAGLVAGCGTSARTSSTGSTDQPTSTATSSTASSSSHTPPTPTISKKLKAEETALHRQVMSSLHHDPDKRLRYGKVPADLANRQNPPVNQVLSATAADPANAIQGVSVRLHLPHGTTVATGVGPTVPTSIQGTADLHTIAVWDLTFANVRGTIPLAARMFTITDEQGQLLTPKVTVLGGGTLPPTVPTGRPFTIALRTRVSVGDGKLRYAPTGAHWLSEWDFDVETD